MVYLVDAYREQRRIIWFLMAIFAFIVTPYDDPYSMLYLWVPMCLLFEFGIYMLSLARLRAEVEEVESDS